MASLACLRRPGISFTKSLPSPLTRRQLSSSSQACASTTRLTPTSSFVAGDVQASQSTRSKHDPFVATRKINLYVKSTRNNTLLSLTTLNPKNGLQGTLLNVSGGLVGFKKVQRSGYEAGYQCAVKAFAKLSELAKESPIEVTMLFNGFGQGREAVTRALLSPDGEEVRPYFKRVTDRTPIPIGGVRPKKKRTL